MANPLKILLLGPRLNSDRSNTGGATQSFEDMVRCLEKSQVPIGVLDTQSFLGLNFLLLPFRFLIAVRGCRVVFLNTSANGITYLSPVVFLLAKLLRKKILVRPFGDSLLNAISNSNWIVRFLISKSVLQADLLYAQTDVQFHAFKKIAKNVSQLKTGRLIQPAHEQTKAYRKRFLFVGHVKKTKGIDEILAAKKSLGSSFVVDIWGPIVDDSYKFLEHEAYYKGILDSRENLLKAMNRYDVLLLPTYYPGEGYPGAIVEAFSQGLPVVTTQWKSIPEMVENGKTGYLITPQSGHELAEQMRKFSEENYQQMSNYALKCFKSNFQLEQIMEHVVKEIKQLSD